MHLPPCADLYYKFIYHFIHFKWISGKIKVESIHNYTTTKILTNCNFIELIGTKFFMQQVSLNHSKTIEYWVPLQANEIIT